MESNDEILFLSKYFRPRKFYFMFSLIAFENQSIPHALKEIKDYYLQNRMEISFRKMQRPIGSQ